jgi:hypothetical protein
VSYPWMEIGELVGSHIGVRSMTTI